MQGAFERLRQEGERDVALAHTTASFHRAKKLERLGFYLRKPSARQGKGSLLDRLKSIADRTAG